MGTLSLDLNTVMQQADEANEYTLNTTITTAGTYVIGVVRNTGTVPTVTIGGDSITASYSDLSTARRIWIFQKTVTPGSLAVYISSAGNYYQAFWGVSVNLSPGIANVAMAPLQTRVTITPSVGDLLITSLHWLTDADGRNATVPTGTTQFSSKNPYRTVNTVRNYGGHKAAYFPDPGTGERTLIWGNIQFDAAKGATLAVDMKLPVNPGGGSIIWWFKKLLEKRQRLLMPFPLQA